jgi:hypothetical protein
MTVIGPGVTLQVRDEGGVLEPYTVRACFSPLGNPVYPHDGDQVPFDLLQYPVRANAQPAVGAADKRVRRRRIVS